MIFDEAADGTHIIAAMLLVGVFFLVVIAIGELVRSANHRRKDRKPSSY
jgi:hypothetical protein